MADKQSTTEPTLDEMKARMAELQAQVVEREAAEAEVRRIKAYPVIAGMLPKITEHADAVKTATDAKDPAQTAATVAALVGYVTEIQTITREAFGGPRKVMVTANGQPRQGTYAESALAYLADHPGSTAAQVHSGIGANPGGAVSAALSRLVQQGKVELVNEPGTTSRFSLPTITADQS